MYDPTNVLQKPRWPRQESNLNLELRKLLYYPLYYEAGGPAKITENTI